MNLGMEIEYASLNRRIIAAIPDLELLTLILIPVGNFMNYVAYGAKHPFLLVAEFFDFKGDVVNTEELWNFLIADNFLLKYFVIQVISLLFLLAYHVYFWSKFSATPGKMLMKCRIVDSSSGDYPISWQRAVGRFFSYALSIAPLCFGFIIASFTKRKQTVHDFVSKTVVIRFIR